MCPDQLTADELKRLLPGISKDCLRLSAAAVGAVVPAIGKQDPSPALVRKSPRKSKSTRGTCLVVSLIACRRRVLDGDNAIGGFKVLRDAIASRLGVDDADPVVRWEYGQIETQGQQGTIVLIQRV